MCFDQKFHKPFDVSRFARFNSFQTQNVHRSKIVFLLGKKFTGKRIIEKGGGEEKVSKRLKQSSHVKKRPIQKNKRKVFRRNLFKSLDPLLCK